MKRIQPWLDTFSLLSGQPAARCARPGEQFSTPPVVTKHSPADPGFTRGQPKRGTNRLRRITRLVVR